MSAHICVFETKLYFTHQSSQIRNLPETYTTSKFENIDTTTMADSGTNKPSPENFWEPDVSFVSKASQDLKDYQLLAAKTVLPKLDWDAKDNQEQTVNWVMLQEVDLKPLFGDVTNRMVIEDAYEDVENVKFSKIICQLVMTNKAFPGFNHDFLNFIEPNEGTILEKTTLDGKLVTFRDPEKAGAVLIQIVSMLQLPFSYSHHLDNKWSDNDDYRNMTGTPVQEEVDMHFASSKMQMCAITSVTSDVMDFRPVEKHCLGILVPTILKCTTTASPSTLSLFGNMGPTTTYGGPPTHSHPIAMKYFSQPSFNQRSTVVFDRSRKMLQTCAGKNNKNLNLVTHGVCVVPYYIDYTTTTTSTPDSSADEDTDEESTLHDNQSRGAKVTTFNSVKSCCFSDQQIGPNLCGNPIASGLYHDGEGKADLEVLYRILLGLSLEEAVKFQTDYSKFLDAAIESEKKSLQILNKVLFSKFLIEGVDKYYQGFRSIENWQKLHSRLQAFHLPYAAGAFIKPTTAHNLIYQCVVMLQASSRFRLAYLGGLGRHFGVIHSLLGVDPSNTILPLHTEPNKDVVPDFEIHVVGATNQNVDVMNLFCEPKIAETTYTGYRRVSGDIQFNDQSIVKADLTNFLLRWCEHCTMPDSELLNLLKPAEFAVPLLERREQGWYTRGTFLPEEYKVPEKAIEFITRELKAPNADADCLRGFVDKALKNSKKTALTKSSNWTEKAEWFANTMKKEYASGYVLRCSNLWSIHLHIVVFMMSHGFQWYPNRNPVGPLIQFLQSMDTPHFAKSKESLFFPNPDMPKWVPSTNSELLTDLTLQVFTPPENIKVRSVFTTLAINWCRGPGIACKYFKYLLFFRFVSTWKRSYHPTPGNVTFGD